MTGTSDTAAARRVRPRLIVLLLLVTLTLAGLGTVSATALSYGSTVRDGERILPGTTIASVDVSEVSVEEALAAVSARLDDDLDRTITVTHGDVSWETSPRALGATHDLEDAVATAAAQADDLGFVDLVELRWLGSADGLSVDVTTTIPEDEVVAFVARIAEELDRDPRDAEVESVDGVADVTVGSRDGLAVEQDATVAALLAAAHGESDQVEVASVPSAAAVTTDTAEQVAAQVNAAVDAALDRAVTVALGDRAETVSPRDLGATADVAPLIEAAFAAAEDGGQADLSVDLAIGDDAVGGIVDRITAGSVVPARDASLDFADGEFKIVPERDGAAVDRGAAVSEVHAALDGAADRVELELRTLKPSVTAASFGQDFLVVDASSTTLTLFRNGEPIKSWPVAVGTNNSPTPLGTFVVGAKRFEPTWVNPAPDRWGKDLPAVVGPGPDNPLGARAINWNRPGGGDTLIRFHGTPNEASIGTAASNGCVRMFDAHVIELYDMISSGTTIISQR
jgi:lipoprotein-anchoring transpeptidase ErfK/SrfK